jgi:hypothetical protein
VEVSVGGDIVGGEAVRVAIFMLEDRFQLLIRK